MDYIKFFFQFLTVLFPHIMIRVLSDFFNGINYSDIEIAGFNIQINYDLVKKICILYPVLPTFIYFVSGFNNIYLYVQLYYFTITYLVILIGDGFEYFLIGVSLSLFLSESWEIPIYYYRYIKYGEFGIITLDSIFSVLTIISKLSMIGYTIYYLRKVGNKSYLIVPVMALISSIFNYIFVTELITDGIILLDSFAIRFMLFIPIYTLILINMKKEQNH